MLSTLPGAARRGATEDETRPCKRIKLDQAEIVAEADIVNLNKPSRGRVHELK